MRVWVRRCLTCGAFDLSARYCSPEEAGSDGLWERRWGCRRCGEWGFDLVPDRPPRRHTIAGSVHETLQLSLTLD
jgi:hypothetical protein